MTFFNDFKYYVNIGKQIQYEKVNQKLTCDVREGTLLNLLPAALLGALLQCSAPHFFDSADWQRYQQTEQSQTLTLKCYNGPVNVCKTTRRIVFNHKILISLTNGNKCKCWFMKYFI